MRYRDLRGVLSSTVAVMAVAVSTPAFAQVRNFNIPAQSAVTGIPALAKQADIQLLVSSDAVQGKTIRALKGRMTVDEAIRRLLGDADLQVVNSDGKTYTLAPKVRERTALQAPAYQAVQNAPQYDEIIVTAQKKEERITDVPIAMSAFSAEALDDYKIEGGSELLRAVPNVNFSKGNFSMYNFSIRGVGTKAVSASTDPAVAISFNNAPLIRNRLFEAEFFDMERIEVLRGPQGTLYGRNATGGVVNMIPALPVDEFEGELEAEVGSFATKRANGMLNLPISDTLAIRVAGALTHRDGFDYNVYTQKRVNGRKLWSSRSIIEWSPSDNFKVNAIWNHFEEDDNRSRTGKSLCTRDPGKSEISGLPVPEFLQGRFSQGCLPESIYSDAAFGAPNASGFAYVVASSRFFVLGRNASGQPVYGVIEGDPFSDVDQSRNLREIETSYDPKFRANNNIYQFNVDYRISDSVKIISQSLYTNDEYWSSQDFNRFVSKPVFLNSDGIFDPISGNPISAQHSSPGGIFTDPQLGPSDRMLAVDLSRSRNRQFSHEFRVQTDFSSALNFNIGANYLHFKSQDDYFVFNNMFSFIAYNPYNRVSGSYVECLPSTVRDCVYVDPNPINNLDELGHNYFLSRNIVETQSYAGFGEVYWDASENLKVTLGVRVTHDKKVATPIPSQLLLGGAPSFGTSGGFVSRGYPSDPDIVQSWTKPTGRLVVDWKPRLEFTDQTLVYASISRGYKGGGSNPPRPGLNPRVVQFQPLPSTFDPEYLNAIELGVKNSFARGRASLNITGFYYDYKGYQVSQIVDRISLNENFDAEIYGAEFELALRPVSNLSLNANLGLLKTRIKEGERSIDVMNRTQGNEDWVLLRPWLQVPSNCIVPKSHVEAILRSPLVNALGLTAFASLCGSTGLGSFSPGYDGAKFYQFFGFEYDPIRDAPNGGRGFYAPLGGNELPNSPSVTFNIGAEYRLPIDSDRWEISIRSDYYKQSSSYARVYNTDYDKLRGWDNLNISFRINNKSSNFDLEFYIKNVFDKDPITDFFTGSDDSGLGTNVFVNDPRIIGFSVRKKI